MNETELEAELKQLRPLGPSNALQRRIGQELAAPARHRWLTDVNLPQILHRWAPALSAAAVAAIFVTMTWQPPDAPDTPKALIARDDSFEPGATSQTLVGVRDHGIYLGENHEPVRMVDYRFVDTVELRNRATGAQLEVSVPRSELIAFPVSYQ